MSIAYDKYLERHRSNVRKGYNWIKRNVKDLITDDADPVFGFDAIGRHDESKFDLVEYHAYDNYFYGNNKSSAVVRNFNRAWLHHIHNNPHHWQYWVLINDDPNEGEVILEMDRPYIIEMICDWWSFSWEQGDLYGIFNWYDEHKDYIKLAPKTRKAVECILNKINKALDERKK